MDVDDVDILYNKWYKSFRQILETFVPNRTVVIRPRDKPWMNSEIRKAIRRRNRLLKLFCRRNSSAAWENYRVQRNLTTSLIRTCKERYLHFLDRKNGGV